MLLALCFAHCLQFEHSGKVHGGLGLKVLREFHFILRGYLVQPYTLCCTDEPTKGETLLHVCNLLFSISLARSHSQGDEGDSQPWLEKIKERRKGNCNRSDERADYGVKGRLSSDQEGR